MSEGSDDEILELIGKAGSDSEKAMLTVLYNLNKNVVHNTTVTVEIAKRQQIDEHNLELHRNEFSLHREQFVQHLARERELLARGLGAWTAFAGVGMVIVVLGGYILSGYLGNLTDQGQRLTSLEKSPPISREAAERLRVLENQQKDMLGLLIELEHRYDDSPKRKGASK